MFIALKSFSPARGGALLLATACFAAGLTAGALLMPGTSSGGIGVAASAPAQWVPPASPLRSGHPAEVLRVIDGDTFEARVHIWPGMDVTTKIRLRGIDAAELHARCDDERVKALAARDALARILAEGAVGVAGIGQDKFGGRVDADVSTARTPDVSAAMLGSGFARSYSGGRRESWCG
jgi:endonuclease YncB( thermonuclease family)